MSCGCESLLTNVTREPTATVMSRGDAPLDVMVMVVVFVDRPPPPACRRRWTGRVELPPHPAARPAATQRRRHEVGALSWIAPVRRTSARC